MTNLNLFLRIIALLTFIIAVLVAWGSADVAHSAALVPAGLGFWVASTFGGQ